MTVKLSKYVLQERQALWREQKGKQAIRNPRCDAESVCVLVAHVCEWWFPNYLYGNQETSSLAADSLGATIGMQP